MRRSHYKDQLSCACSARTSSITRQELSALVAHAGICVGGAGQPAFLPRPRISLYLNFYPEQAKAIHGFKHDYGIKSDLKLGRSCFK